jgi:hypothetical protein
MFKIKENIIFNKMSEINLHKNFVIDGSENSIQNIINRLKFISKIQSEEIVDVQSLTLSEKSIKTSLYRTFLARNESRQLTLEFFQKTIKEAFDRACFCFQNKDWFYKKMGTMITKSLGETLSGLENVKKTYESDRLFTSSIDTLVETIKIKIQYLEKFHDEDQNKKQKTCKKNR